MGCREEVEFVLSMLQHGKVSKDQAAGLIDALTRGSTAPPAAHALERAPQQRRAWKEFREPLQLEPGEKVFISLEQGSVEVIGVPGALPGVAGVSWEQQNGGGVKVERTAEGTRIWGEGGRPLRLRVSLHVNRPVEIESAMAEVKVDKRQATTRVRSGTADVQLLQVHGSIQVETGTGDVTLEECGGERIQAETGTGDIAARLSEFGLLKCITGSGDVTLEGADGRNVEARTGSGDIHLRMACVRDVGCETASGDVSAAIRVPFDGSLEVRTHSGDVDVSLHPESSVKVDLRTDEGDLLGREVRFEKHVGELGHWTGTIGKGDGLVSVTTTTGNITLRGGWTHERLQAQRTDRQGGEPDEGRANEDTEYGGGGESDPGRGSKAH